MTADSAVVPIDARRKPKPPPLTISGDQALDQVQSFVDRFIVFPTPHDLTAVTLWIAHTWAISEFYVTPRLVLDSAEPGSGKTRVLEVANLLVRDPEMMISATTAAIFRLLDEKPFTLLFDEVDAIFSPKASGNSEDLRALLNAGYKRGATIARCVGDAKAMKVQRFTVFAPVALAGLAGNMPTTITTRAVVIHMRRRGPGETVEPFRERDAEVQAAPIKGALSRWVLSVAEQLGAARPDMPSGVVDRPAEIWEALLAVADAAGGDWPKRAREACRSFVLDGKPEGASLGVRLLSDLRDLFTRGGVDRLPTVAILDALCALDEAPWGDLYGKPLDARRLSKELGRYGVRPGLFRNGDAPTKGYRTDGEAGLADAWERYLPPAPEVTGYSGYSGNSGGQDVTDPDRVTDASVTPQLPVTS